MLHFTCPSKGSDFQSGSKRVRSCGRSSISLLFIRKSPSVSFNKAIPQLGMADSPFAFSPSRMFRFLRGMMRWPKVRTRGANFRERRGKCYQGHLVQKSTGRLVDRAVRLSFRITLRQLPWIRRASAFA